MNICFGQRVKINGKNFVVVSCFSSNGEVDKVNLISEKKYKEDYFIEDDRKGVSR